MVKNKEYRIKAGKSELVMGAQHPALLMGILNVTPDSFSDGAKYTNIDQAVAQARLMQFDAMIKSFTGPRIAYRHWYAGSEIGLDDETDFLDHGHLTPSGATKLTAVITDIITDLGWLPLEDAASDDLQIVSTR